MRQPLWLALGLSACANLAGIEAGHLRDDVPLGGAGAGMNSAGSAGVSGSEAGANAAGSSGAGASAGTAPNGGGSAGQLANAGQGQGGGSSGAPPVAGAGAGAGGSSNGGASGTPCPTGMVQSLSAQGNAYCIDAYEVTNAQYLAFTQSHTPQNTNRAPARAIRASFPRALAAVP